MSTYCYQIDQLIDTGYSATEAVGRVYRDARYTDKSITVSKLKALYATNNERRAVAYMRELAEADVDVYEAKARVYNRFLLSANHLSRALATL